ncbi:MAG TPA: hypothetical protein VK797_23335 [Tepidisphaeraceae bacterium]|nr:hypothetical protein [Tepidisphaeraceae bacterium]
MKTPLLIVFAVILPGCAIAPYDLPTDTALSSIQSRVDQRLTSLQNPPAVSPSNPPTTQPATDFYPSVQNDLHSLSIRLGARQQGDPSIESEQEALAQVTGIVQDIQRQETRSTTRATIDRVWEDLQSQFDTAIGSVLGLELKRK